MHIYQLRSFGSRVRASELLARPPAYGWLQYKQTPLDSYGQRWEAHLLTAQGGKPLLPPLFWARLRRVDGVMHLVGREDCGRQTKKASPAWKRQSWMCAADLTLAAPMLERLCEAEQKTLPDDFDDDEVTMLFRALQENHHDD